MNLIYSAIRQRNPLRRRQIPNKRKNILSRQLVKSNTNELVLQRRIYLAYIITNQAEAHTLCRRRKQQFLQRLLRILRHIIHLVQNDEFHADIKEVLSPHELVNLVAYNIDTALVRGIQMYNISAIRYAPLSLVLLDQINNRRRLARPRRPIEEQVRKHIGMNHINEEAAIDGIQHNIIEMRGPVFLNPGFIGRAAVHIINKSL
jgi:hypothetical protein